MRRASLLLLAAVLAGAAVAALLATRASAPAGPGPVVTLAPPVSTPGTPGGPASPSPSPAAPPLSPQPSPGATAAPQQVQVRGLRFPIAGACLPPRDDYMPNAPRPYRAGIHEGVDLYPGYACTPIFRGQAVMAAGDGVILRADHDYRDPTPQEMDALLTRSRSQGYTDAEALDRLRGRQVWIDHGGGIVTRYAHLLDIPPAIRPGVPVRAGQAIGYVGNSGTPEGLSDPSAENHIHLEIRINGGYLGQGLGPGEVRALYERALRP